MKHWQVAQILVWVMVLASCEFANWPGSGKEEGIEVKAAGEDSDFFVPQTEASSYEFVTNKKEHWSNQGYTLWGIVEKDVGSNLDHEVKINKRSGYSGAGYGVIFGNYTVGSSPSSMLLVLINNNGYYSVGVVENNEYRSYTKEGIWKQSTSLTAVEGSDNIIKITGAVGGSFTVQFNNGEAGTYEDDRGQISEGIKIGRGFMVITSPKDNFPDIPVRVRYTVIK